VSFARVCYYMTLFTINCKECNKAVANSNNVLARHLRNFHNIEWPDYIVKHEHAGIWPICACGCGEKLEWQKGGFESSPYNHRHGYRVISKGEKNPMYGKKGPDNPNYGKVRTEEHRKNYSRAAEKRWKEEYDERVAIIRSPEVRKKNSDAQKVLYETTDKAANNSRKMHELFVPGNPKGDKLRKEASDRAKKLLDEGKIGPQAPFKAEWKFNPFTNRDEYMHSSYESLFLDECIARGYPVTKKHEIYLEYIDEDGIKRDYVADFVSLDGKRMIECKGRETAVDIVKAEAGRRYCDDNAMTYVYVDRDVFEGGQLCEFLDEVRI